MAPITRILCPVDFSEASRHAIDHAIVVARWYKASITALHVCIPPFIWPRGGSKPESTYERPSACL